MAGRRETISAGPFSYQPLLTFGNGARIILAQESFLPMQGVGWAGPAEINSETAKA